MKLFLIIVFLLMPLVTLASNFTMPKYNVSRNTLYIPAVYVTNVDNETEDRTRAYKLKLSLNDNLQFSIKEISSIPNFEFFVNSLLIGSTHEMVIDALGQPTNERILIYTFRAIGATPVNFTEGTVYEEWEYIVDDIVYLIWFAATSDVPKEDWILQGTTWYEIDAIW